MANYVKNTICVLFTLTTPGNPGEVDYFHSDIEETLRQALRTLSDSYDFLLSPEQAITFIEESVNV